MSNGQSRFGQGKRRALPDTAHGRSVEQLEYAKTRIRARVEPPFHIIQNILGFKKMHYRGLAKNTAPYFTLFGTGQSVDGQAAIFCPSGPRCVLK